MTALSRLTKLEKKLKSESKKIYSIGWANCQWNSTNGINRRKNESKKEFCIRAYKETGREILWFD
jgi:hypothetical protein